MLLGSSGWGSCRTAEAYTMMEHENAGHALMALAAKLHVRSRLVVAAEPLSDEELRQVELAVKLLARADVAFAAMVEDWELVRIEEALK
jgi:hypothetical protein